MAEEEERSFAPNTVSSNRAQTQGLGAGQREMDQQREPGGALHPVDPQRTEPFDQTLDPTTNADRPSEADFTGQEPEALDDAAEAAPSNVGEPQVGQEDNPQEDWGDPAPDAVFSANHTRRPLRTEAERGQGAKTRTLNKDIVSRRAR